MDNFSFYIIPYWVIGQLVHILILIEITKGQMKKQKRKFVMKRFISAYINKIILNFLCCIIFMISWDDFIKPNFSDYSFIKHPRSISILVGYTGQVLVLKFLDQGKYYFEDLINSITNKNQNQTEMQYFPNLNLQSIVVSIDNVQLSQQVQAGNLNVIDSRFYVQQGVLYFQGEDEVTLEILNGQTTEFVGSRPVRNGH